MRLWVQGRIALVRALVVGEGVVKVGSMAVSPFAGSLKTAS
jgi:hypothetical protein